MSRPFQRKVCYFCGRLTGDGALCDSCREREEAKATARGESPTVKRLDIFGQVHDTHRTEADLNGWREKQGALL